MTATGIIPSAKNHNSERQCTNSQDDKVAQGRVKRSRGSSQGEGGGVEQTMSNASGQDVADFGSADG